MTEETDTGINVGGGEAGREDSPALDQLNILPPEEACSELLKCCGSTKWARRVAAARPFAGTSGLLRTADRVWWELGEEDWLEAFRSHPQIGGRKAEQKVSREAARWSEDEQSGTRVAAPETLTALAAANRDYVEKFNFIFIVCAAGKTSGEMLSLLRERLSNDPDAELRIAAEEQRRITHLRLRKLLQA